MLVEQPIDKIIEKSRCKYILVKGIAKRARKIIETQNVKNLNGENKPITLASREYWDDYFKITENNKVSE